MRTVYEIDGMTCQGCVGRVREALSHVEGVQTVEVDLQDKSATIVSDSSVPVVALKAALHHYEIEPKTSTSGTAAEHEADTSSWRQYQPLILTVLFILGVSALTQYPYVPSFDGGLWMRHCMAGFFIVFSFFKLLDLPGFADSYAMYDVIAERWKGWGYLYPFLELSLGILYLIGIGTSWAHVGTLLLLGVGTLGVVRSNLQRQKIKCACLGTVFDLPMSTVTIVENLIMMLMASWMLLA